uniref:Uncharacterized protein n=1 Tax=Arundo donax TaxID=35708 RepID=A0A0A9G390_ARUDO
MPAQCQSQIPPVSGLPRYFPSCTSSVNPFPPVSPNSLLPFPDNLTLRQQVVELK